MHEDIHGWGASVRKPTAGHACILWAHEPQILLGDIGLLLYIFQSALPSITSPDPQDDPVAVGFHYLHRMDEGCAVFQGRLLCLTWPWAVRRWGTEGVPHGPLAPSPHPSVAGTVSDTG